MRSIYTESRIDSYRYYHLSKESDLTELVPRIPDNFLTKNKYEDSKTPRVVFAPSINQCLMGLSRNLTNEEFYVYTPYLIDLNKLKKPHINQVPDCEITGEVWSTEKIRVKKVGKIRVTKDAGKDGHPYIFGNQQKAELYDWEYKVLIDESTQCFDEISKEDIKRNKLLKPVFIINTYTGSAFANLMKATLKFEYTHALISMDSSLSSMYSYDDNKIVNNKLYKGFIQDDLARYKKDHPDGRMRVTCILVTSEIFDNIMHSINYYKKREKNTAYSILNLFKWIAGSNKISSWGDLNMFCSEFVDTILKHNNIDITGKSAINTAPDDFGKYTGRNNIFVVFEGAIKDYNYKEVNKKIEDMKKSVEYDRLFAMTSTSMKSRNDITVNKKNHAGEILYNIIKREDAVPYDSNNLQTKNDTEFELPSLDSFKPDIQTLFDNADLKHIWLTSDWHFFKNHYKKEANYVNTREILTWCRKNLGKDDIFVYLGDISFRYANKEDQEQSQKFMASIPAGRKILVLGNHDRMLGDEYFTKCGFDYVVEEFTWNKYLFTHRPVNMDIYPSDWWNIHGHCHNIKRYNTTDGLKNVNVYPKFYNNKPVTLDYLIKHKEDLVKNNEWNFNAGYGETTYFIKGVRSGKTLLHEAMIRNNYPKPVVYFSQNINSETIAYMVSLFQDRIGSRVGIKLHFGESGNKNFLNPKLLKDLVKCTNAALIDSNTAYDGSTRGNTSDHIQTAHNNGFDFGFIDILDADGDITISVPKRYQIEHELNELHNGNKKGYESPVSPGRHLQEINVGSHIKNYDSLIVYTHFKGHSLAGYGGALKNIGMGIPSGKVGKKQIHGQGWEKGLIFLERLVESASAIESMFDGKIVYVNVLANISTACDCDKDAPKPIMPNIGVLVSDDIVAIEQASIDLIRNTRKNKDIMEQIAKLGGFHQIEYMKFLGMGRSDYKLKSLNGETIKLESALYHENNMYTINDSIIRKAISAINAEYKKYNTVSRAGNQNCLLCTWCLEAQLRGYNVLPRPVFSPRDPIFTIDASSLINAEKIGFRSLNELIRIIKESENYSRFYTHVNWSNSSGGHEFLLANIDGAVKVLDAQAGLYIDIESSKGHEYFDDINYQNSYIVKWSDGEIDMQKLYRYNNKAKIVRWNNAEDIAYLKANNMISDESAMLLSESATSIKDINSNDIALENSAYINEEAGLGKKCSDVKSVSKNINLYRVTVDTNVKKSLANSDYIYFNMYDEDRDFYKGTWRHALNNTYKTNIPYMYEATFVLTKDLKLPNHKERLNIARTFLYNEDVLERIAAGCFSNTYIKRGYTDKEITDFATEYPDDYKVQINNRVNNYKSMPIEELFYWFCTSLAYKDRRNMELYVKELKRHGYNAVFDDHGIDGGNTKNIGIFPIIIFDPSKAVRLIEINKVTKYEEDLALERWQNWYNSQYSNISYHESSSLDIGGMFSIPINEAATSIEESRFTKFKDDYSKNTSKHLSDFTKVKVDDKFADEHKDIAKDIKNQGLDYNKDVAYVWMNKNDKWVAKLYIDNTNYGDGKKWIAMIEVSNGYRGCGLGKELVMHAINVDKCDALGVHKDNKVAIKLYESCGFKISDEAKERVNSGKDKYYWMYRNGAPKPGMYHSSNYDENAIQEGYIKDEPDLYWKRKEFNEGKINLCFITGLSGSGKSTMGADMAGKPNVDHCDMDNVVFNCNFDDKELSELGEMINAFFKGPGRQYRLKKGDLQSVTNNHRTKISNALVDFAIKYAASHKNTKFIVEGVYLFWMVSPEKLKDCAVYIKGTSSIKSAIRAAKRDGGMQDNTKDKVIVFSKTLAKKFYGMTYNTGNIDRWRKYYQTLQDKEEKSMKEAYIFNKKDIYYNRNKFNNGETNLCFITGQSGSGKSTMGKHMQGRCEVYDLDDVIWNKESFTMDNFKEYGELIYTFFNGKGKKYYLTAAELKGEKPVQDGIPKPKNNWDYEHDLINDFVNYAISWAKSHKDIKYVLEGIWIYMYIEPSKLKDYAVYIKGTSMLTSIYRASKRDNRFKSNILHPGMWIDGEKGLKKYRDYFEPRSEESIHEVKRADLPDSAFGIPEDRKFPLDTEQHVKSAIHLFGHAEESKKKSLAKRISSAAKKYDIRIPETTQVYKYLNESVNEIIPDGIENIIFDMGKVLIDANTLDALYDNANIPDEYCEEIRDFINEKLFYGSDIEYKRKIQGYDLEQIRDYLTKALPEHLSPYMDDILDTLKPAMFIYSYVPEMLDLLRSMGYKLYYLSNWDRYSYDLEKEFFDPLLEQFDGGLFSFELGEILKPDREMYEALCEKYHIFANKSIFFDDMEENIEAARSVGMAAYKFDKDITPKILFGTCVRIPDNSDDLILIANGDDGFTKRHISEFGWWYLDETRTPSGIDEEYYYKTLDDAIKYKVDKLISQDAFTDDSPNVLEYVYTNAKAFCEDKTPPEVVCVGQILLYESGGYEWVVQYPLKMENRILCGLKEFSMASINPVIGINKPFLIKVGDQNHPELLPTDHFVYSQDIESDKVLTVDSDNHLKVKKVKDLDIIEAYEFVGDMAYIHRLNKLYKENAEVSNLYTLLTNKPMLTEDQIDFDPSFKRIDFDLLKQKELAEMVTLRDNLMEAMNYNPLRLPVLESAIIKKPSFLSKYNTAGDISIKEDFDGVYFYSDITKKRSASAASTLQLTENMLRAIL